MRALARFLLSAALPLSLVSLSACVTEDDEVASVPEEAFPGQTGRPGVARVMSGHGELELAYEVIDGMAIAEGDIVLGKADELEGDVAKSASRSAATYRWTHGWVPYQLGSGFSADERNEIEAAVALWDLLSLYDFRERTTETSYIVFRRVDDGCSSAVGRQTGVQYVNVSGGCSLGNVLHEVGHALGLYHEQMRADRDRYITINWRNIEAGKEGNFRSYVERGLDGTDQLGFDFGSIMLYGSYFFSDNGEPTIVKKDGSTFDAQRSTPSDTDLGGANRFLTYAPGTPLFNIRNVGSGLCLDLGVDQRTRGTRLSQRTCDGSPSQRWYVWDTPNSAADVIINAWSGMCVAGDASASDPQRMRQLPCNRLGNMGIWLQYAWAPSTDRLLTIPAWSQCVEVRGASTSSGAAVDRAACDRASNQRWRFTAI